ncbi:MAG TPA: serine/threonine-protein kinase, partial [Thermoanaerobaculia bacterium]|nr:serine/threonine-protein kinase [Thermoanaerobaculia bacterium]
MIELTDRLMVAVGGRYLIEKELGRGGMAVVFLATDTRHDRRVAIKVLQRDVVGGGIAAERFLREVRIASGLSHPHILTVHESGEAGGLLYYVMPYVEGESLRDRLRREGQLGVEESVRIAGEVAEALAYAHERGVIHRDIKPENILLMGGHAVVADFGIARALDEAGADRLTSTGLSVGTPAYMSPEQAAGERTLDARTDVYALGAVLYEMLAGEPPFTGPS